MIHALYRAATAIAGPLIRLYLNRRMRRGKEHPARFAERLGQHSLPRPAGPLVWLHAASVGESLSLLPLIENLAARMAVLVTTGTVTSAKLMVERLPPGAFHQFVPVDRMAWVRPFLDYWRPDLALWAESEFWPNLLAETHARRIPLVLVQGRVSAGSHKGWKRFPGFIRTILGRFTLCLAQSPEDADRLRDLGAADVRCLGNLKMAVPPLPFDKAERDALRDAIAGRPLWLAASTHPGEEEACARIHKIVAARYPNLLTIIVPRHPHRGPDVAAACKAMGVESTLRSAGQAPDRAIHIADTMGELGLFYDLSPIAFVGKSLGIGATGGQNPFEPARMGAAVLFGPYMDNFPGMVPSMLESGAAMQVADEAELAAALIALLADGDRLRDLRAAATRWAEAQAHALDHVVAALTPFLDQAEARHART